MKSTQHTTIKVGGLSKEELDKGYRDFIRKMNKIKIPVKPGFKTIEKKMTFKDFVKLCLFCIMFFIFDSIGDIFCLFKNIFSCLKQKIKGKNDNTNKTLF
jgi:hypothetical protein